ncbi:MAG: hypothetical protein RMI79_03710 [Nitrososphaerota archaeon]|nr:hypothetical protein [Nitrososphaerota archaeon]
MRVIRNIMLVIFALLLFLPIIRIRPQPSFLIGLNMVIEFTDGGIARVILKQHPFDFNGISLLSNEDVVKKIMSEEESTIESMLLFFTSDPSKSKYKVVSHIFLDVNEEVFSNTGKPGIMDRFKGALVLIVDVFLNSTSGFVKIDDDTYQVFIPDYFTLRNPSSWIDVMEIRIIGNVKMLNFSVEPAWAKHPLIFEGKVLKWFNLNEADAPDSYVLTLEIPGVVFSKAPRRLRAEVSRVLFSDMDSTLRLSIRNTGAHEGFFIVSLSEPDYEQARKVFLKPGEESSIVFPVYVSEGRIVIKVFGEEDKLFEETISLEKSPFPSLLGFFLIIFGIFLIFTHIEKQLKESQRKFLTFE